ncbi:MAG TPA: hypothetical protein VE090_04395 [Methylomirabilota bacterium]|nr:hypothetical protein [Methylomirabilota bacterium]
MTDNQLTLSVTVKKPEQTLFDGFAKAVSSVSNRGKFDVLPYHANFIALIKEVVTIHEENKEPLVIPIKTGVIKVQNNIVKIILGIETKTA